MKTSVVIPFYNGWELTHPLLWGLWQFCRDEIDEVVLVDDCSTDVDIKSGVGFWQKDMSSDWHIRYVRNKKNVNFLLTANRGMSLAKNGLLILISNDVLVKGNFIREIKQALDKNPKRLIGGRVLRHDTGWNNYNGYIYPYVEGWLIACTKDTWEDLGGFDESYKPHDLEDVDLSATAIDKGYELYELVNKHYVQHIGAQTIAYSQEREAQTKRNVEKFKEKWL